MMCMLTFLHAQVAFEFQLSPSPPEPPSAQSHDQAGFHGNSIQAEAKVEANNTTLAVTSGVEEKASGNVPMENHNTEMVGKMYYFDGCPEVLANDNSSCICCCGEGPETKLERTCVHGH